MLHITNGDATATILRRTSLAGEIVPFREALVAGPAPEAIDGEEWIALRAAFLAGEYDAEPAACADGLRAIENAVASIGAHDETILWFEHDLFCQANLLYLLDRIAARAIDPATISLIVIDSFPGVEPFHGLGQLSPADLETLFARRSPLTRAGLDLAADGWNAYRSADPTAITRLLDRDTSALPYLQAALLHHLARFPSSRDGLGAVERAAMERIASGDETFPRLFNGFTRRQPLYGYGDLQLHGDLKRLAAALHPLLTLTPGAESPPASDAYPLRDLELRLTDAGRDILAGRGDAIALNGIDRWLGGVHLMTGSRIWRWDGARLVAEE